jgi:hypothetical protein
MNLLFSKLYLEKAEFEILRKKIIEKEATKKWRQESNSSMREELLKDVSTNEPLKDALLLSEQIAQILTISLNGNPRQTKRFLNTLLMRSKMATSKNISLKKRVLSKLMLLEYFLPETFKAFNKIQAMNEGIIPDLKTLELEEKTKKVSNEIEPIKDDKWFQEWLKLEPPMNSLDLSPYFYFSRDKLSVVNAKTQRMSPEGRGVYAFLQAESDIKFKTGLERAKNLNQADIVAIFEDLTEKVKLFEGKLDKNSPLKKLVDFSLSRMDFLAAQLIQFLRNLPERDLTAWLIPTLQEGFKDNYEGQLNPLFEQWEKSGNKLLGNATKQQKKTK